MPTKDDWTDPGRRVRLALMIAPCPEPVRLIRRDPARNMARFYTIAVLPTLFGDTALLRQWGRIGSRGRVMMETFGEIGAATAAGARIERSKRRRGYRAEPIPA